MIGRCPLTNVLLADFVSFTPLFVEIRAVGAFGAVGLPATFPNLLDSRCSLLSVGLGPCSAPWLWAKEFFNLGGCLLVLPLPGLLVLLGAMRLGFCGPLLPKLFGPGGYGLMPFSRFLVGGSHRWPPFRWCFQDSESWSWKPLLSVVVQDIVVQYSFGIKGVPA